MQTVYVISKELDPQHGNAGWDVYEVYSDADHAYNACAAFAERYPEWSFYVTTHDVIEPVRIKGLSKMFEAPYGENK